MDNIGKQIIERMDSAGKKPGFSDALFVEHNQEATKGASVVIFGAGDIGVEGCSTLHTNGVHLKISEQYLQIVFAHVEEIRNSGRPVVFLRLAERDGTS